MKKFHIMALLWGFFQIMGVKWLEQWQDYNKHSINSNYYCYHWEISPHTHHFFFFFLATLCACRILVPPPAIEPAPLAVKVQSPNHWTTREFPEISLFRSTKKEEQLLKTHFKKAFKFKEENKLPLVPQLKSKYPWSNTLEYVKEKTASNHISHSLSDSYSTYVILYKDTLPCVFNNCCLCMPCLLIRG